MFSDTLSAATATQAKTTRAKPSLVSRSVCLLAVVFSCVMVWGLVQFLALLVQAERVRSALESSLSTAQLPEADWNEVTDLIDLNLRRKMGHFPYTMMYFTDGRVIIPLPGAPAFLDPRNGETLRAQLEVETKDLLPRWLGPPLPGLFPSQVQVAGEIEVH